MKKIASTVLALAMAMSGAAFAATGKHDERKNDSTAKKAAMEDVIKHPIKHLKKFVKKHDRPVHLS